MTTFQAKIEKKKNMLNLMINSEFVYMALHTAQLHLPL